MQLPSLPSLPRVNPLFRVLGRVTGTALLLAGSASATMAQDRNDDGAQQSQRAQQQGAEQRVDCSGLPDRGRLLEALRNVVTPGDAETNGGLGNHMWAVVVNRSGAVCNVVHSGETFGDQWPGSRAIAASKAFTTNAFSLKGFALSTANLYWPSMPHSSLYALETSNPLRPEIAYRGPASSWGAESDPMIGQRVGGITLFGGGLALYTPDGELVGGLGLSGDQSCTDHVIAWKLRHDLNFDNVPKGVNPDGNDNIIYDLTVDPGSGQTQSASGYGHPVCSARATEIARSFPENYPTGPEE